VKSGASNLTGADIQSWCEQRLARYKVPRQWHFVDDLPKTANGKVRKPALRELMQIQNNLATTQ
jgi:acyl-coenzyme A synthetase/AMP-(fatty) acid ligase